MDFHFVLFGAINYQANPIPVCSVNCYGTYKTRSDRTTEDFLFLCFKVFFSFFCYLQVAQLDITLMVKMAAYNLNGVWDLSIPPQLPSFEDKEFISLLQKQFGVHSDISTSAEGPQSSKSTVGNIDPQILNSYTAPGSTSPLSDDSPSPPSARDTSRSRRQSDIFSASNEPLSDEESGLKRKASEEFSEEPHAKLLHTGYY